MPNVLLPVPFFRQSRDGFCLPACAAMILAYWGQMTSEAEMSKLLQTKSSGLSSIAPLPVFSADSHWHNAQQRFPATNFTHDTQHNLSSSCYSWQESDACLSG
ncbi:MAG: C39 family peptidase [Anaerolineae bacterium]|nr:C39 family peptidase [Anaerolineae bacterium]